MWQIRRVCRPGLRLEMNLTFALLPPLNQPAFEVVFLLGHIFPRDIFSQQTIDKQPIGEIVALIQIDRTEKSLQGIPVDVFLQYGNISLRDNVTIQSDLDGQPIQRRPTDNAGTQLRQYTLLLFGILNKQKVRNDRFNNCIPQKFKPFVINWGPVFQKQGS